MSPKVKRSDPPYLQIVEYLRHQIRTGKLHEGDLVPSTRQLAREWGVAINTATKALTRLRSEGFIRGVPGVGTVVCAAETQGNTGGDRLRSIAQTGRIYPPDERAEINRAELVPAPAAVADALGLQPGVQVIRRQRITFRDDVPVSASTSWLPGHLAAAAPRLLQKERITEGTAGYIEAVTGRAAVRGLDQDSARGATVQDAADLGVPAGSAVACGRNWWYDASGDVIEYGERVSVPGRWSSHHYEITPEGAR
jgi:DNA-binding GntR family transcriptional regulator